MKRCIAFLLAVMLLASLTACGSSDTPAEGSGQQQSGSASHEEQLGSGNDDTANDANDTQGGDTSGDIGSSSGWGSANSEPLDPINCTLDGIAYKCPMQYSDLLANGWYPSDADADVLPETVEAYGLECVIELYHPDGGILYEVWLHNYSGEKVALSECTVTSLSAFSYGFCFADLQFPDLGLHFKLTREEMTELFGEPDDYGSYVSYPCYVEEEGERYLYVHARFDEGSEQMDSIYYMSY